MSTVEETPVFSLMDWFGAQATLTQHVRDVSQRISKRVRNVLGDESMHADPSVSVRDRVAYMLWVAAARVQ